MIFCVCLLILRNFSRSLSGKGAREVINGIKYTLLLVELTLINLLL